MRGTSRRTAARHRRGRARSAPSSATRSTCSPAGSSNPPVGDRGGARPGGLARGPAPGAELRAARLRRASGSELDSTARAAGDPHLHGLPVPPGVPAEGRALAAAFRMTPAADRPLVVAVSVNPWKDTPASARTAIRRFGLAGFSWRWLLGLKGAARAGLEEVPDLRPPHQRRHRTHRRALPDRRQGVRAGRDGLPVPADLGQHRPEDPGRPNRAEPRWRRRERRVVRCRAG